MFNFYEIYFGELKCTLFCVIFQIKLITFHVKDITDLLYEIDYGSPNHRSVLSKPYNIF